MSRIFLSYAREDAHAARQLASDIASRGHEVWWDTNLRGGSRFISEIEQALRNAEAVVVLWSPASVNSAWVQDEAAEGRDSGRLIPIAMDSATPPLGFRQFHTIDLGAWDGGGPPSALPELLDAIDRICPVDPSTKEIAASAVATNSGKTCICVLPFLNISGEPEQEYFSDGITQDIITDLSKISALSVISRNTAFSFKGKSMDVRDVARSAGVSHVLEGSVRKVAGRVRISAQLVDGAKGDHIWAERYDRDLTDIFAIQDEISQAIVEALRLKLLPEEKQAIEKRGTASVDAYNLYLMARQEWVAGSYGSLRRDQTIARICRQATVVDPDYAEAWALMALAQAELKFWHGVDDDAISAAERALSLNPSLAEPHCVIARYREEEDRPEEAKKEIEEALRLNPESWEVNREAARLTFRQGRLEDSIPYFEKAASLSDGDWHNPAMLFGCYRKLGDEQNQRRILKLVLGRIEQALAKDPTNGSAIAMGVGALAFNGEQDRAWQWIERGMLLDPGNLSMRYNFACSLVMELHDYDAALDMMQDFFERTTVAHIRHVEVDPDLDPVRNLPRFRQMLAQAKERLGIPPTGA